MEHFVKSLCPMTRYIIVIQYHVDYFLNQLQTARMFECTQLVIGSNAQLDAYAHFSLITIQQFQ